MDSEEWYNRYVRGRIQNTEYRYDYQFLPKWQEETIVRLRRWKAIDATCTDITDRQLPEVGQTSPEANQA